MDTVYIRGSKVRFMILPDMLKNAPMFRNLAKTGAGTQRLANVAGRARGRAAAGVLMAVVVVVAAATDGDDDVTVDDAIVVVIVGDDGGDDDYELVDCSVLLWEVINGLFDFMLIVFCFLFFDD